MDDPRHLCRNRLFDNNGYAIVSSDSVLKMKNYRKIASWSILPFVLMVIFSIFAVGKVSAASPLDGADYTRISKSIINATLSTGTVVPFKDSNPDDSIRNFKIDAETGDEFDGMYFCQNSRTVSDNKTKGITLKQGSTDAFTVDIDYATAKTSCLPKDATNYRGEFTFSGKKPGITNCNPDTNTSCICSSQGCTIAGSNAGGGAPSDKESEAAPGDACSLKGFTLNWIFCPIIYAVDEGFNELNNFVEEQLNYDTDKYLNDNPNVKRTWSIARVLATSLLVIIMLVMVISQAINAGLFDAYTVRKMLPRLIVAAIAIQLSWPAAEWVITLANNAGKGIYDLLAVPFGGREQLELEQLLGKLGNFAAGSTVITAMLSVTAIAFFNPFGVLLFAFSVLLAVLIAAAILLFRNILILACVILVPLALIAWILPGTKKYWDLWKDNFTKALLLFPIIMAIIVIGRIFAYIVATTESGIFDWLAVLVGFFGPYFLLPKAFKWGGSLMATAGNQISSAGDNFGKKPREFLKGRQEGYHAMKLARSQERVARGEDKFSRKSPASWIRNPIDKLRSGKWDPTLGLPNSSRRERAIASYVSKGLASEAEDIKVERDSLKREWEALLEGGGVTKDDYLQDIVYNRISDNPEDIDPSTGKARPRVYKTVDGRILDPRGRKDIARRAALEDMGMLAGGTNYRHIESMYERVNDIEKSSSAGNSISKEDREFVDMFTRFKNDNVSSLMPKMTHMYKGVVSTADAGPQGVAGMHGTEVESMLGHLSERIKGAKTSSDRASAVQSLNNFLSAYLQAAENDNLRGGMELGGTRAVKAFLTKNGSLQEELLKGINSGEDGRATLQLPGIDAAVADAVNIDTRERLDALIRDDKGGGFKTGRELQAAEPVQGADNTQPGPQSGQNDSAWGTSLHGPGGARPAPGVTTGGGSVVYSSGGPPPAAGVNTADIKKAFGEAIRENADVFGGAQSSTPTPGSVIDPQTRAPKPPDDKGTNKDDEK